MTFDNPVSISADTTYVASYHSNGHYTATGNFFISEYTNGDGSLSTPAAAGVYTYGASDLLPTSTSNANYWVDVLFGPSGATPLPLPPVANNDSGFVATENTELRIPAAALLANDTDASGFSLSILDVSNLSNGTVTYDSNTDTVIFTPTTDYAGTASFNYSVSDGNGGSASATVSLLVNVNDPSTLSLFNPATTPSIVTVNDPSAVELGVKFQASTDGSITGLRFYKGPDNDGAHTADLWNATTGELLATTPFTDETPEGWQQVNFTQPVQITGGETYVASYHTSGNYSADPNLFATAITNTNANESLTLTAPSSAASGGNGVYAYGSDSLMPTNSFNATSYGVDVIFKGQLAA